MIWETYQKDTVFFLEQFRAEYPDDLLAALRDEQAKIMAQHVQATEESAAESAQEQVMLEGLETHDEPDTRPDFIKEIQERRMKLLTVFRVGTSDQIAYEVREHIRRMDNTWLTMRETEKKQYADWHTTNIQDKGLKAPLIDLVSSLKAKKIPIKHFGRPRCRDNGDDYHASSPKSFQDHCKRLHQCSYQEARDSTVLIMDEITHCEIALKAFWGSGEQRLMRFVMPMCSMPYCAHHAIPSGG